MLVRAIIVALVASAPELAAAALCNGSGCSRRFQLSPCGNLECCWAVQSFRCSDGAATGSPTCAAWTSSGVCAASCDDPTYSGYDSCTVDWQCPLGLGAPEVCNGEDDDFDGCADEDCPLTKWGNPRCTCTKECATTSCSPPTPADCDPFTGEPEVCGNEEDDNCNGVPDEGCLPPASGGGGPPPPPDGGGLGGPVPSPPKPPLAPETCPGNAGADPIVLAVKAAATEPFIDFSVTAETTLSLTRTYSSADVSLQGGPHGPFGRGWHHEWEATLSCRGDTCTVGLGLVPGYQFEKAEAAISLDGSENWDVYRPSVGPSENRNLLVRRPDGTWRLYFAAGRELHFATVCDACGAPDAFCMDPLAGGRARVVKAVGGRGDVVHVSYDRPAGLLFELRDDLGHALGARSYSACTDGLARELVHDGDVVATYAYDGLDLQRASDAEGATLRSYAYEPGGSGRVLAVLNEAGVSVTEFSYDAQGRAIGVYDAQSSVGATYPASGIAEVTEYFGNYESSTGQRQLDVSGRVLSVSDGCACGPAKTFTWSNGNMVCSRDSLGYVTWQEFDALGRLTRRAEFKGSCVAPSPNLLEIRDERRAYGLTRAIAQGVVLELDVVASTTRPSALQSGSASLTWSYDPAPDPIDPPGYACQAAALPVGSLPCRKIEAGYVHDRTATRAFERHATFYSYDARGRLVRTLGPLNLDRPSASDVMPVEEREYWGEGEALQRRGRLREVRRYASPSAPPLVTRFDHDAFGIFQITGPDGGVTTIVRDGRGRPRFVAGPDGRVRETRYYDGTSRRLEIAPGGAAIRFSHGPFGLLASLEHLSGDPEQPGSTPVLGWSEHYQYDAAGNRTRTERRGGNGAVRWVQERAHDVQHRVVRETHPESPAHVRTWDHDASGFLSRTVDEEGRATTFTPDGLRRVKTITRSGVDASGAPVSLDVAAYTYEYRSDALRVVKDGKSVNTSYKQDDFGRTNYVTSVDLAGGQIDFVFDARGNVLRRKDNYVTIESTYDGLDRLLTVSATSSADGNTITYVYAYDAQGAEGRLASITNAERELRFTYDAAGRLLTEELRETGIAAPLVTEYAYGSDGALSGILYPSGLRLTYERDPATREVVRLVDTTGTVYADAVEREPFGPLASLSFGNALSLSQSFTRRYETLGVASGPLSLAYTPSPAGDVASIADGVTTRTFAYDFLDRLIDSPGWFAYGHDGNGNRITETVDGVTARYQYYVDRVTSRQRPGATAGSWVNDLIIAVDNQSNVAGIRKYGTTGTVIAAACFRNDALGRLTFAANMKLGYTNCATDAGVASAIARFEYDARNRRVARWSAATGEWTEYVHDPSGALLSELRRTGDPASPWEKVRDYVWLDGRPLAQVEYAPGASHVYYFHVDAIGLPRALTNQAGQTVWSASARPYGDLAESVTPDPLSGRTVVTNLRLPGQYDERLFAAAGLSGMQGPYYNWNRWYLPGVGRYLELDPIALRGHFNARYVPDWYNYALGNPLRYTDPLGLYGTNDCSYYEQRCAESGGRYYCDQAQYWCNKFPKYPDPDPNRDDDYEGWARCTRQCLQDCDRDENRNQNSCPPTPDQRKGPWDPRSSSFQCHVKCYTACALGGDKYGHPDTDY